MKFLYIHLLLALVLTLVFKTERWQD